MDIKQNECEFQNKKMKLSLFFSNTSWWEALELPHMGNSNMYLQFIFF